MAQLEVWKKGQRVYSGGEDDPNVGPGATVAGEDELEARSAQAREWLSAKAQRLVESLDPYVDGTLGSVSPRHAQTYVQALRFMAQLWSAPWERPKIPDRVLKQMYDTVRAEVEQENANSEQQVRQQVEAAQVEAAEAARTQLRSMLDELRTRTR